MTKYNQSMAPVTRLTSLALPNGKASVVENKTNRLTQELAFVYWNTEPTNKGLRIYDGTQFTNVGSGGGGDGTFDHVHALVDLTSDGPTTLNGDVTITTPNTLLTAVNIKSLNMINGQDATFTGNVHVMSNFTADTKATFTGTSQVEFNNEVVYKGTSFTEYQAASEVNYLTGSIVDFKVGSEVTFNSEPTFNIGLKCVGKLEVDDVSNLIEGIVVGSPAGTTNAPISAIRNGTNPWTITKVATTGATPLMSGSALCGTISYNAEVGDGDVSGDFALLTQTEHVGFYDAGVVVAITPKMTDANVPVGDLYYKVTQSETATQPIEIILGTLGTLEEGVPYQWGYIIMGISANGVA